MAFLQLQWWWCWWWWVVGCPTIKQNFFDYFMLTAAASRSHLVFGFGHKVIAGPALKKKGNNPSTRGWEMANQPTDVCTWSAMRRLSEHPAPHIGSVMKLGSKKLQYSENMKTRHWNEIEIETKKQNILNKNRIKNMKTKHISYTL